MAIGLLLWSTSFGWHFPYRPIGSLHSPYSCNHWHSVALVCCHILFPIFTESNQCCFYVKTLLSYTLCVQAYRYRTCAAICEQWSNTTQLRILLAAASSVDFRQNLCLQKTRVPVPGLSLCGVVSVILRLAVLSHYRRVPDGRRTDRQTDVRRQPIPR